MDYVPENPRVVLKISDFNALRDNLAANSLLGGFEGTAAHSFFADKNTIFKNLDPSSPSLLCINTINDSLTGYTFITRQTENLFQLDSINDKTVETLQLDEQSIQRITLEKEIAYSAVIDSVFVLSSSQQILLDVANGKTERDTTFKKVFTLPTAGEFSAIIRGRNLYINDSTQINFTTWSALDVKIAPESLTATGISLATDSIPQLLNVFEGQVPQQNAAPAIIPASAKGGLSLTFNDAEKLQNKLRGFRRQKPAAPPTGIFGSASEIGEIQMETDTVFFLKSIDAQMTQDALAPFVTRENRFREVEISRFSKPELFKNTFAPLINSGKAKYVFQLDNFFVFAPTEASGQQLISDFQNNKTLANTAFYENSTQDLSTASSLVVYGMNGNFPSFLAGFFPKDTQREVQDVRLENYPLIALQFSFDRNFAHVNFSCREAGAAARDVEGEVSERFSLKLDNALMGNPQLVENSEGQGSYITVQDIANKLYFISQNGKILWTKTLDSPILGTVQRIEISRNGHLAFVTAKGLHILDYHGRYAKGFPIKYRDEVTQPLSVFDYDNNHNYRLVVVQDKEVLMYDKFGKTVKGFGFKKTKSSIVQPPVHIRMGNKDYIVIAEENGKLNILSRVGKPRVTVGKSFHFSEVPIVDEDGTFVVITTENTKERIDQNGKVTSQKLEVGANYWFAINGGTKATLDGNLLRIDGKMASLPLGIYSKPRIFKIHRKTYITLTETQEKKVYVFDTNAQLLAGFPIYGSSEASMAPASGNNVINLSTKGDSDSVILYSF